MPLVHDLTLLDSRALVDAGALVGAVVLAQGVAALFAIGCAQDDVLAGDRDDLAIFFSDDDLPRIAAPPGTPYR